MGAHLSEMLWPCSLMLAGLLGWEWGRGAAGTGTLVLVLGEGGVVTLVPAFLRWLEASGWDSPALQMVREQWKSGQCPFLLVGTAPVPLGWEGSHTQVAAREGEGAGSMLSVWLSEEGAWCYSFTCSLASSGFYL